MVPGCNYNELSHDMVGTHFVAFKIMLYPTIGCNFVNAGLSVCERHRGKSVAIGPCLYGKTCYILEIHLLTTIWN